RCFVDHIFDRGAVHHRQQRLRQCLRGGLETCGEARHRNHGFGHGAHVAKRRRSTAAASTRRGTDYRYGLPVRITGGDLQPDGAAACSPAAERWRERALADIVETCGHWRAPSRITTV